MYQCPLCARSGHYECDDSKISTSSWSAWMGHSQLVQYSKNPRAGKTQYARQQAITLEKSLFKEIQ